MASSDTIRSTDELPEDPSTDPRGPVSESADDVNLKLIADLWDAFTHCTETKAAHDASHKLQSMLENEKAAKKEDIPENQTAPVPLDEAQIHYLTPEEMDLDQGLYQVTWRKNGLPAPLPSWRSTFSLRITGEESEDGQKHFYFQVFQSEDEANIVITGSPEREFDLPESDNPEDPNQPLKFRFGHKYYLGPDAFDESGQLKVKHTVDAVYHYEFAEHAEMGDNLWLKWSDDETTRGEKKLQLRNQLKLSYGEINALGGDFFGTFNPISGGQNFDEQCKRFKEAYRTLAEDTKYAVAEVPSILANRREEMDVIAKAAEDGGHTYDAYKGLVKEGDFGIKFPIYGSVKPFDKDTEELVRLTADREDPNYLMLSQLNFDHFGGDGVAAYNAGHYYALQEAAAGNLELAYTINAFADHFLGDQFAAGHLRTPRRKLHGASLEDAKKGIDMIVQVISGGKSVADVFKKNWSSTLTILDSLAPDACSKYMHDEDNYRGLWVRNKRGDQWHAFGDKKLNEKANMTNKKLMKEALQASVNEVYEVFLSKVVKQPGDFAALQIAPSEVVEDSKLNHAPLFNQDGWYRWPFENTKNPTYYNPTKASTIYGYKWLAIKLNSYDFTGGKGQEDGTEHHH